MRVVNVQLGPDQADAIEALAKELGVSKTTLLREGLRLVRVAVREARHGNMLGLIAGDAVVTKLVGVWEDVRKEGTAA